MRWMLSVALAALMSGVSTAQAQSPRVSLSDALNNALANGCTGAATGAAPSARGLFTADEIRVDNPVVRYQRPPAEAAILFGDIRFQTKQTENENYVDATSELEDETWYNVLRPIYSNEDGRISAFSLELPASPNSEEETGPDSLPPLDSSYRTFNLEEEPGASVNYVRVTLSVSQVADVTTTSRPHQGVRIESGLRSLCTISRTETRTINYDVVSSFGYVNDRAGPRSPTSLANPAPLVSAGALGSATAVGANRAQDNVLRRERGLNALIERLRRRAARLLESEAGYVQLASLDQGYVPAAPQIRNHTLIFDLVGGVVNTERKPTDLEGGFSADSVIANAGAAVAFRNVLRGGDALLLGFGLGYESTESQSYADPNSTANQGGGDSEAFTGSAFVGWSIGALTLTTTASYGSSDQTYERYFSAQGDDWARLAGALDQTYTAASLQAQYAKSFGGFTLSPRVSFTYAEYETERYIESASLVGAGGGGAGLALEYAPVKDEWTEGRIGITASYVWPLGADGVLEFGVGADAVFVGDAETPLRTAYFAQDQRQGGARFPIIYAVDSLDDQYYDVTASLSADFGNGFQPYVSVFSRQGHKYTESEGVFFGLRFTH